MGGAYDSPITTTHLGTSNLQTPSQFELMRSSAMRPEKSKYYMAGPVTFSNIVVLVLNSFLEKKDLVNLSMTDKLLREVVPEVMRLLLVDWKPLLKPRLDYEDPNQIDVDRVDMATALAVRSGLDPGKIVRTMGGEYVGANRNVKSILKSVESVVSKEDNPQRVNKIVNKEDRHSHIIPLHPFVCTLGLYIYATISKEL